MSTKTVLCAVDVSNRGRDACVLKQASRLAELDGAQLDVVTVVPDYGLSLVGAFFDAEHHEKLVEEARRLLNEVVVEALGEEANESVRHVVATGNAYDEILNLAEANGAGLIVIGAHKPDFADRFQGPNSARVARYAKCSVLIVRD